MGFHFCLLLSAACSQSLLKSSVGVSQCTTIGQCPDVRDASIDSPAVHQRAGGRPEEVAAAGERFHFAVSVE